MKFFQATLVGRLGTKPEPKQIGSGTAVSFRLAVKDRRGETVWVGVLCWGQSGEFARQYLDKKDKVLVVGDMELKPYINKDGDPEVYVNCSAKSVCALGSETQSANDSSGNGSWSDSKRDDWGSESKSPPKDDWGSSSSKGGNGDPIPF
tara:strand:- start:1749 stop:2195 length:447 start_codon:yes stop_codon:yes gene_type:complete